MDRFDTWLDAQRGWRLLLVRWVVFGPAGLIFGGTWTVWATLDPPTPQVRVLLARMALGVAASFLLITLTLVPRSWRSPARRPGRAWITWRRTAGLYSAYGSCFILAYEDAEPLAWQQQHHHGWVSLLLLTLLGVSAVMYSWDGYYRRRLRRRRDHGVSG